MASCATDGNQGFPVPIMGALTTTDLHFTAIQDRNQLYPSFGPRKTPRKLVGLSTAPDARLNIIDEGAESTITYSGRKYSLIEVQISRSTQDKSSSWPTTPKANNPADAVFFFSSKTNEANVPATIALIVPLYEKESRQDTSITTQIAETYFADTLQAAQPHIGSLEQIFRNLTSQEYVQYVTCIPLRQVTTVPTAGKYYTETKKAATSTQILTCYFPGGWILPKATIDALADYTRKKSYAPVAIPANCRNSFATAARQPPAAISTDFLADMTNWSAKGETFTVPISVAENDFTKRFRWVSEGLFGGEAAGPQQRLKTTFEYKCMPLDKVHDIDGNYVLLDPATGDRSLKETLEPTAAEKADLSQYKSEKGTNMLVTFAAVVGTIIGIVIALIALSYMSKVVLRFMGGEKVVAAAVASTAAATATAIKPQTD